MSDVYFSSPFVQMAKIEETLNWLWNNREIGWGCRGNQNKCKIYVTSSGFKFLPKNAFGFSKNNVLTFLLQAGSE